MKEMKKKNIIYVIVGFAILLIFCFIVFSGNRTSVTLEQKDYEKQQLKTFTNAVSTEIGNVDTNGKTIGEVQSLYSDIITSNQKKYGGSSATSVDAFSIDLLNNINSSSITSVNDLNGAMTSLLDFDISNFVSGIIGSGTSSYKTTLTLRSSTACSSVADSKYCLEGSNALSANVYITNPNSGKWAVLLHGYLMSGSLIYNTLGSMYEQQDYNIIAPDLRGFGNSGGSVAMGYLESLDVYDWIKDLNANYSNRYGVSVAPDTIIVHGVSLGGATTLQLATNPDIAAKKGGAYTLTLDELNVKGFVDDCGYTSMSGIVTSMMSSETISSSSSLNTLLDSLNVSEFDFMSNVKDVLNDFNIGGFDSVTENSYINFSAFKDKFSDLYNKISSMSSGNTIVGGNNNIYNDFSGFDWSAITEQYGNWFNVDLGQFNSNSNNNNNNGFNNSYNNNYNSGFNNGYNNNYNGGYNSTESDWTNLFPNFNFNVSAAGMNNSLSNITTAGSANFLDGVVGTAIMDLVGVGLTEENYDYYSNVFSEGRHFPANAKVVIIHGTSDTTVPHSNADTVAANISPATLVHKWDATGNPHAFIVVGMGKTEYENIIRNFTNCINNSSCTSISR